MLIVNKGMFTKGFVLMLSFLGVFLVIFMPVFGEGRTGLEYSDDLFNKLSKSSANYLAEVNAKIETYAKGAKEVSVTVKLSSPEVAIETAKLIAESGAKAEVKDKELKFSGSLAALMLNATKLAQDMYNNNGQDMHSFKPDEAKKKAMELYWGLFSVMFKQFQFDKLLPEASIVSVVNKKALEPAYNYYGIEGVPVLKKIPEMAGLLIFYVVYTMWYGYAIFYMFDGVGLSMKKSKVKKEV